MPDLRTSLAAQLRRLADMLEQPGVVKPWLVERVAAALAPELRILATVEEHERGRITA